MSTFILKDDNGELVDWGVNKFPDGQQQFWISRTASPVNLTCALRTPEDIDLFRQIIDTIKVPVIDVLYMYGARSDKYVADDRFVANVAYLTSELFSDAGYKNTVTVLSPHSHDEFYDTFLKYYIPENLKTGYNVWIFPDESAFKRFGDQLPKGAHPIVAQKKRDQVTGEILSYEVNIPSLEDARILVVDDLCDGGRTFLELAQSIPSGFEKLDLYITHGVFSNNAIDKLLERYSSIHVTNSLRDLWKENTRTDLMTKYCNLVAVYDVWNDKTWKK